MGTLTDLTGSPIIQPTFLGPVTWTPTGSWTTNATYTGKYWQTGSLGRYYVKIALTGAPTATALTVNMPSLQTIDSTVIDIAQFQNVYGQIQMKTAAGAYTAQVVSSGSNTTVAALYQSATTSQQSQMTATSPVTWASGDFIELTWTVPVTQFALTAFTTNVTGIAAGLLPGLYQAGFAPGSPAATIGLSYLGEVIESNANIAATTASFATVTTITVTEGVWDIGGSMVWSGGAGFTTGEINFYQKGVYSAIYGKTYFIGATISGGYLSIAVPSSRVVVLAGDTKTFYFQTKTTGGNATAYGYIRAERK